MYVTYVTLYVSAVWAAVSVYQYLYLYGPAIGVDSGYGLYLYGGQKFRLQIIDLIDFEI